MITDYAFFFNFAISRAAEICLFTVFPRPGKTDMEKESKNPRFLKVRERGL